MLGMGSPDAVGSLAPQAGALSRRSSPSRLGLMRQVLLLACCWLFLAPSLALGDYIAAVLQHPVPSASSSPSALDTKLRALEAFDAAARAARLHGAQVLVAPEFGLMADVSLWQRANTVAASEPLPEVDASSSTLVPCLYPGEFQSQSPALFHASCSARNHSLLLLVNVFERLECNTTATPNCPKDGRFIYNSNVLLDEQGALVAKYRKSHPFFITAVDAPPTAEVVTYTSSFGVRFGMFICFDIAWEHPAVDLVRLGVRDFLYAAAIGSWGKATAARAWSYLHGSNLLMANQGMNSSDIIIKGSPAQSFVTPVPGYEDTVVIAKVPS